MKIENYFIVIIHSYVRIMFLKMFKVSNTHECRHLNESPRVIRT